MGTCHDDCYQDCYLRWHLSRLEDDRSLGLVVPFVAVSLGGLVLMRLVVSTYHGVGISGPASSCLILPDTALVLIADVLFVGGPDKGRGVVGLFEHIV